MAQFTFTLQELESVVGKDELKKWFMDYDLRDYLTAEQVATIREHDTWSEEKLARDIILHYYTREVGLETPAMFKLKLKSKLDEVMEEKAPLLYSMALKFNPLDEFEINETTESHDLGTVTNNGSGLQVNSTTPMGEVNKTDILSGRYASSTVANENENKSETGNDGDTKRHSSGRNSSPYRLIAEYRANIVAFNKDVISDLAELFLGIYS
jgi:hypothetical protein